MNHANYRSYVCEFNRCRGDNLDSCCKRLKKCGILVYKLPQKTSLLLLAPKEMTWNIFKNIIRKQLDPKRGSVLVHSKKTGNSFICRSRSNRPGIFVNVIEYA